MKLTPAVQRTLVELRDQGIENPSAHTIITVARAIGEELTEHEITQALYITLISKKAII
jgi:hypothetical protein